jgi:eukaryotic-like serine/threonine-protein kinase
MGREVLPPERTEVEPDDLVAGRYRLDRSLGNGGMGEVFVATDTVLDRRVALKRLSPALADDEPARARFFREARALARINSPNVVGVFDAGGDREPFLVMELIDGITLRDQLRRTAPLDPARATAIAADVAGGLAAAHSQGVIHRDVKPSNIFLTGAGEAKVGDFGIARVERGDMTLTMTGQAFGSPAYIAPEQATGGRVDARADLYSLGCVLYEMLAGRPPFEGGDAMSLTYQHVHTTPAGVDDVNDRVSPTLASLVDALLQKQPADRPSTADEVRRALLATASTEPLVPLPPADEDRTAVLPGRAAALGTKPKRPWWLIAALAGLIVLSTVALVEAFTDATPAHPRRSAQATPPAPSTPPTSVSSIAPTPQQAGAALVALATQVAATDPPAKHVAEDIQHTVQEVLDHLDEPSSGLDKLAELKSHVDDELGKGHLTSAEAGRLDAAIDRFAGTLQGAASEGD